MQVPRSVVTPHTAQTLVVERAMHTVRLYGENLPNILSFRFLNPTHFGGYQDDLRAVDQASRYIQDRLIGAIHNVRPNWDFDKIMGIRIMLEVVSPSGAVQVQRYTIRQIYPTDTSELKYYPIFSLIARAQQSGLDIYLYDFEIYAVIQPAVFMEGAGGIVNSPWLTSTYSLTHKEHRDKVTGLLVNCAAFALAFAMSTKKQREVKSLNALIGRAVDLANLCGWKDRYVRFEDFEAFTTFYTDKRVVIVAAYPHGEYQIGGKYVHTGVDFDFHSDLDPQNDWEELKKLYKQQTIYLVYHIEKHYSYTKSPGEIFRNMKNNNSYKFCDVCLILYNGNENRCGCFDERRLSKKQKIKHCMLCNAFHEGGRCPEFVACKNCNSKCPRLDSGYWGGGRGHRCLIIEDQKDEEFNYALPIDKNKYCLFGYDIESALDRDITEYVCKFTKPNGMFNIEEYSNAIKEITLNPHKVNLIILRNVFTGEPQIVFSSKDGSNPVQDMIVYLDRYNGGKNVALAHNGAGYDTRLIFEEVIKLKFKDIEPIQRGQKYIQLKVGKTYYRDTMQHMKGSLSSLSEDYLKGHPTMKNIKKGCFPHYFNLPDKMNYSGDIPALVYYGLDFVKDEKERNKIIEHHKTWNWTVDEDGEFIRDEQGKPIVDTEMKWVFIDQQISYCGQDVDLLCECAKKYHWVFMDDQEIGRSPWFHATAPSFIHSVVKQKMTLEYELPEDITSDEYANKTSRLVDNEWCVLTPYEYWFARKALRGGRTDIRKVYHRITPEEKSQGKYITYVDIVSMYPYVQMAYNYPTSYPEVQVYDSDYYPCTFPECINLDDYTSCPHPIDKKRQRHIKGGLETIVEMPEPTVDQILGDDDWFGIVLATVIPPTGLYHPILVTFSAGKSTAPLTEFTDSFNSAEFKKALEMGYKAKLHVFHKYKKRQHKGWVTDILPSLYLKKEMTGGECKLSDSEKWDMVDYYEENFGMGDMVKESFSKWRDSPAERSTYKTAMNSMWGKHAEYPNHDTVKIYDNDEERYDEDSYLTALKNVYEDRWDLKSIMPVGNQKTLMRYSKNTDYVNLDFHRGYLPCAVFVPAYGRLMLWEQLNKLGKRVLMHDTDSIVYVYDPKQPVIDEGDYWGQWSQDKFQKKNGVSEAFVGLGPKSYALKAFNGKELVKLKGLSLKFAHGEQINFDSLEEMVTSYLNTGTVPEAKKVPQFQLPYKPNVGVFTGYSLKNLSFNVADFKGIISRKSGGLVYPRGYCVGCIAIDEQREEENAQEGHSCLF